MWNNHTLRELIVRRRSCRSYEKRTLSEVDRRKLEDFLVSDHGTPFGTTLRFSLIAARENDAASLKGLGTYGFIKNPPAFIAGAAVRGGMYLEDFGYAMERIHLYANAMGLGTCWLGGTFSKSAFADRMSRGKDETIPAVTSIGYAADSRRLFDSLVRLSAGSDRRKDPGELFFSGDFGRPLEPGESGAYDDVLELVRLSPSASNKQPWRIVKGEDDSSYHFFLARTEKYFERNRSLFGFEDLQRVDMGISICHFDLAAAELGMSGVWKVATPPDIKLPETVEYRATWKGD